MAVLAGEFKLVRGGEDEALIADFLAPGELHGVGAILLGRDHDLSAVALDDSAALLIPAADFRRALELHPRTFRLIAALGAVQNRVLRDRLHEAATLDVHRRLHLALLRLARRFGRRGPRGAAIELRVTHRELGQYIGASRENVSLALARLKRDGLLATAGRRLVVLKSSRE
jgi:CRP-like cAMP-binding protein